ncbi:MAG TPA: hypothetical protein VI756_20585 [Blastocatellia bacterium]
MSSDESKTGYTNGSALAVADAPRGSRGSRSTTKRSLTSTGHLNGSEAGVSDDPFVVDPSAAVNGKTNGKTSGARAGSPKPATGNGRKPRSRYKNPVQILRDIAGRPHPESADQTYGELVALELYKLALQDNSLTAKMTAIREIHDRLAGKARPSTDVQVPKTDVQLYEEAVAETIKDALAVGWKISREDAIRMVAAGDPYIYEALGVSEADIEREP